MQKSNKQNIYYFVDESGDSCFYDKHGNYIVGAEGCSKLLLLGFIKTEEPTHIRKALKETRHKIINDPYLKDIPSLQKSAKFFHATDDCPEVRQEVFKCLSSLNFKSQFVVARKKVSFVWDIYDTTYPKNYYNKTNEFDVKKISLL